MTEGRYRLGVILGISLSILAGVSLTLTFGSGLAPARADANAVSFPSLEELEHYTTVERGVTREHMLTSPEALAAIKAGQSVPVGTHVVLVDYQSGELHRYLVSQKMGSGPGDWQYQWFWPDKSIKADENTARCYSCHSTQQDRSFMFTFNDAVGSK